MATELKTMFKKFMEEYAFELANARATENYKRPFGALVRKDIAEKMQARVDRSIYKVKGSVGAGRWTDVPWIAVFDTRMTKSAQKGVYIVYLLNKDSKELFLTLNQGATDVAQGGGSGSDGKLAFTGIATSSNGKITTDLKEKAKKIREEIGNELGLQYGDLNTGSEAYNAGCIFYKKYDLKTLPEDEQLYQDLSDFVKVYNSYYEKIHVKKMTEKWLPGIDTYNPGITKEKWLELLNDPSVFKENNLLAMACLYDNAGEGSCTELGEKYRQSTTLWKISCGVHLAERIANKTECPRLQEDGKTTFFVIPFLYQKTSLNGEESFLYKLRPELFDALTEFDILRYLPKKEGEEELSIKETLEQIKNYIENKGFSYNSNLIENFYLSLKSKPFVLLAGTSGTGKTRLVRLFAEAIGAFDDNRYLQIAVKPDWSDSTDLFGHVNLDNEFVPGAIIEFIYEAANDENNRPYILCLDEMNLARVEYYLSDFLSIIETRDWKDGSIVTDKLIPKVCYSGSKGEATKKYESLIFPENLYVIGTVNMDETTFPFSKKVLDRANTIEFSYVDFDLPDSVDEQDVCVVNLNNDFLRADFLRLRSDCGEQWETVKKYNDKLKNINEILKQGDAHFGYRMRDEIIFYMLYRERAELLSENEAFDNQIMQKILPRIQGSSESIATILRELFNKVCAGPFVNKSGSTDSKKMESYMAEKGNFVNYPRSAEKIWKMLRRFEDDDFTSYWV